MSWGGSESASIDNLQFSVYIDSHLLHFTLLFYTTLVHSTPVYRIHPSVSPSLCTISLSLSLLSLCLPPSLSLSLSLSLPLSPFSLSLSILSLNIYICRESYICTSLYLSKSHLVTNALVNHLPDKSIDQSITWLIVMYMCMSIGKWYMLCICVVGLKSCPTLGGL